MKRWTALLCAMAFATFASACAETDAGITTKVKAKLAADDTVKAYQIDVDTQNKVVTLKGVVESPAAKTQAARLARETEGVTSVIDNMTVSPKEAGVAVPDATPVAVTDATITAAVKTKLLADPDVAGLKIDVDTMNGIVTLSGQVKTAAEKDEALRLARETDGVKGVTDKLTLGR